jgi:hypothetical protein
MKAGMLLASDSGAEAIAAAMAVEIQDDDPKTCRVPMSEELVPSDRRSTVPMLGTVDLEVIRTEYS